MYKDAEEMEKVFNAAYAKAMVGSGLPGAPDGAGGSGNGGGGGYGDERMTRPPASRSRGSGRKQVLSDDEADEYLTPSDDD